MKKAVIIAIALIVLAGFGVAFAAFPQEGGTTSGSIFEMGQDYAMKPDLDHRGDVYIMSGTAKLQGKVKGNVFVMSGDVTSDNLEIDGSLFVFAGKFNGKAKVDGQVYMACGEINDSSEVQGDIKASGGKVVLSGNYAGEVMMAGSDPVEFNGHARKLYIAGDNVVIGGQTKVEDSITIAVPPDKEPTVPEGFKSITEIKRTDKQDSGIGWSVRTLIFNIIVSFLLGLLFIRFGSFRTAQALLRVKKEFHWSILIGLGLIIGVPIAALILIIALFPSAIFPAIMLFLIVISFAYLGTILIHYWLGGLLLKLFGAKHNDYLALAIGVVLVSLVFWALCFAGPICWVISLAEAVFALTGCGAIFLSLVTKPKELA